MFLLTFLWWKAEHGLVLMKPIHYGNFLIGGSKMS